MKAGRRVQNPQVTAKWGAPFGAVIQPLAALTQARCQCSSRGVGMGGGDWLGSQISSLNITPWDWRA